MVVIGRPDGQLCDQNSKTFAENLSCLRASFGRCCPVVRTVARSLQLIFIYRGFALLDQKDGRPDSWSDAHNFHIWYTSARTMMTGVRTSRFQLRYLPYRWAHPDRNPRCPDGCSNLPISVFWKEILMLDRTLRVVRTGCWIVWMDASWSSSKLLDIEEGPDGNPRRPDRWCFSLMCIRKVWHVVQTVGREPNFLTCKLYRIFWKNFWITESLLKSIFTKEWFCPTDSGQLQINKLPLWPFWDKNHLTG
jgi:hypothetical protein